MDFESLLHIVEREPVFETAFLLSGDVDPFDVRKQLSRWTAAGKLYQLRRGLYTLAPPYQKSVPHPFLIANRLVPGSYVSLQSALAYYGMIPEAVPLTTSVTTARPDNYSTPLGTFEFRHIQTAWFQGYSQVDLGNDQWAFVARREKALLDLVYLQPGGDALDFLSSLRLQSLGQIEMDRLEHLAAAAKKPKLARSVKAIQRLAEEESEGYRSL